MKYGIAIFPGKELQDVANSYRKRYDPKYALIPPHITLIGELEANNEEIEDISNKLETIAKHYRSIPIKIVKVSSFKPVSNVIYLKVEPNANLEDLQKELVSSLNVTIEHPFVPHITLGQELSSDEHLDLFSNLSMQAFNHEEVTDRFHLLYELENGSWTVLETFRLGKEK
ncbi:2'-5' RNA ligase family protein [Bacillus sp. B1-b2]|uniref:2'-5' RNA ligase family protein n=1 Tax=Bacillus sp. B1-b2 TaxID=2653201 RepID=UPI0012629008|nr:2'-5' RNA ligase family protein [Bacillus sp. B1-b2]KAB7667587.1 hypothetical protein F9279_15105 [Bacillus sp. B1-b2]